ncbi:hypothetical protein QET93_004530 [Akkermansia sp. N21116]|uniref:hypothetical protein n=1 Tax=Akkermansia sp. N21116 TaxID=3040764 RepID=UPI00244EB5E4|nr:hypothetical protein [Akkermansia sp. N21116]WPX41368.1 hypothetical protein QET93_004530 [Akkermansia sp. N21116]
MSGFYAIRPVKASRKDTIARADTLERSHFNQIFQVQPDIRPEKPQPDNTAEE